jgi:hypothetical protein
MTKNLLVRDREPDPRIGLSHSAGLAREGGFRRHHGRQLPEKRKNPVGVEGGVR